MFPLKVFISWSGGPSRALAEAFHWWLPKVIQGTTPFVSAKDIDKGSNWTMVLAQELEDTDFGVVCITPENLTSPWLNYEAGAISKSVRSRVCPVLFGVDKQNLATGPLSQLQLTSLSFDDIRLMVHSINKAAGSPLSDADVDEAVGMWWPRLEDHISKIAVSSSSPSVEAVEPPKPQLSDDEIMHEVLTTLRRVDKRLDQFESRLISRTDPELPSEGPLPWVRRLYRALNDEGIAVRALTSSPSSVLIQATELPQSLPGNTSQLLHDAAQAHSVRIRLRGTNRVFEFNPDSDTTEHV